MTHARGDRVFVVVASAAVRLRRLAAEPALLRAVAGRAGDRVLVFAGQALHDLDAAVSRAGDGGGAGRRLARGRRPRRAGSRGCSALAIGTWVGGFDVLYACQDLDFDRAHGLRSIPVRFGVPASLAISRAMHVVAVACLLALAFGDAAGRRSISPASAVVARAARLRAVARARRRSVAGQARVRSERLRRHPLSARPGGVDLCPLTSRAVDRHRDHRRERRALRDAHAGGAARRAACTSSWSSRTTAAGCCATSSATQASVERLMPFLAEKYGDGVDAGHAHRAQQPRPRRDDRQRQPRLQRHGDRAVLDEDAGRRRARAVAQPRRARRRRDAQGAAAAGHRAARDADEPAAAAQHGALRRSRRDDPAGDAGVLSACRRRSTTSPTSWPGRSSSALGFEHDLYPAWTGQVSTTVRQPVDRDVNRVEAA